MNLYKLFRVRLKVGQNWRIRPGPFLNLIRSVKTAGSVPLGQCRLLSAWLSAWLPALTTWITLLSQLCFVNQEFLLFTSNFIVATVA